MSQEDEEMGLEHLRALGCAARESMRVLIAKEEQA